jgi:hypothetical protein
MEQIGEQFDEERIVGDLVELQVHGLHHAQLVLLVLVVVWRVASQQLEQNSP